MKMNGVDSVFKMLKSPSRKAFVLCIVLHILSALITRGGWRKVCVGRGSRHLQLIAHLSLLDFCNRDEEKLCCTKWDGCRGTFLLTRAPWKFCYYWVCYSDLEFMFGAGTEAPGDQEDCVSSWNWVFLNFLRHCLSGQMGFVSKYWQKR